MRIGAGSLVDHAALPIRIVEEDGVAGVPVGDDIDVHDHTITYCILLVKRYLRITWLQYARKRTTNKRIPSGMYGIFRSSGAVRGVGTSD